MSHGLESPASFYEKQNTYINNIESNKAMEEEYRDFLNAYLEKNYEQGNTDSIIEYTKAMGQSQELQNYIDFLLDTKKAEYSADNRAQLALLKNRLVALKKEIQESHEDMGPKDFEIVGGRVRGYPLQTDSFKYLGENKYEVTVKGIKRQGNLFGISGVSVNYGNSETFYIQYDGHSILKVFGGRIQYPQRIVIDHKIEEKNIVDMNANHIEQTKYQRGNTQNFHIDYPDMDIEIKFYK